MTDKEIIKALEYCSSDINNCKKCPYLAVNCCTTVRCRDVLALVERQQAEIEMLKLQLAVKDKKIESLYEIAGAIRKQSIEKFAERLGKKNVKIIDQKGVLHYAYEGYEVADLVKEMTEKGVANNDD